MSKRSPPYTHNEQRFMNSQNACTTKKQNGPFSTIFLLHFKYIFSSSSSSVLVLKFQFFNLIILEILKILDRNFQVLIFIFKD